MILGFAGWSGSGKTTLIRNIIPNLIKLDVSVSTIKHAHEEFDIDKPGKDSFIHRKAGAEEVLISSNKRFALIHEYKKDEMPLKNLLNKLKPVDLIIVEGWKNENIKKIEIHRSILNKPLLYKKDKNIIAIATDNKNIKIKNIKILDINNYNEIATFIKNIIEEEK